MAELVSQENEWKPALMMTTSKLYKKLTTPIRMFLSTSSLIFFLISFSLLSISLLSLSSQHPTFWFLLSNSIIFFIAAADFNPSNPNRDYYNEHLATTHTTTDCNQGPQDDSEEKSEPPIAIGEENEKTSTPPISLKFHRRSKSEDAVGCDQKMLLLRSTTMANGSERSELDDDAAADPLSNMSDEELNRRIEEFITKFNRAILLEEMKESEEKEM
ncbi:hypothetical protein ACLOJK_021523 [Asimina triloba]